MDKLKQWIALTVVGMLVIGAGGWFLLVSPRRSEAADVRGQADAQRVSNQSLQSQIAMLKAQAKELPQKQAKLAAVAAKLPDNPALPALIRNLTAAADLAGVELVNISPTQPVPVAAAKTAPVTPAAAGSSAPVATGGSSAPVTAAAPRVAAGLAGTLESIGVSLNVVGGYFQIEQFLDRVEGLSRAMKVTGVSIAPGSNPVKPQLAATSTTTAATPQADPGKVLSATITSSVFMAANRPTANLAVGK